MKIGTFGLWLVAALLPAITLAAPRRLADIGDAR